MKRILILPSFERSVKKLTRQDKDNLAESLENFNSFLQRLCIVNGIIILKDALLKNAALAIEGTKIASIGKAAGAGKNHVLIDAKGCFVSPGFIDSHIHGNPAAIFTNEVIGGTTSIVIALSCAPLNNIYKEVGRIKAFAAEDRFGPNLLGIRMEGPYISRIRAGAQDRRYIRKPDARQLRRILKKCGGLLKIMTVAPELEGAVEIVKALAERGVAPSVGHSDAAEAEAAKGISAGIRHATHIFNAMSGKEGGSLYGATLAALEDKRVTAEVILDLIHVSGPRFRLLVKTKDHKKIILVTDSVRATPPATKRKGGVYRFKDGRIAGSSLTMIEAVRNASFVGRLSLVDAVRLATFNPARFFGVQDRKGAIAAGMDADLVMFDKNFNVKMTIIRGGIAYNKLFAAR